MKLFSLLIILLVSSCSLPEINTRYVKYKDSEEKIVPEKVKVIEERFPKGITLKNNVVEVEANYEKNIEILGRIEVELKRGSYQAYPFSMNLTGFFYDREKKTALHSYCEYNMISALPLVPGLNMLNPFAWPCFAIETYASEDMEDQEKRKAVLIERMQRKAAEMGANVVAGFQVGGLVLKNVNTGTPLANYHAWSATGYAIRIKQ